MKGNLNNTELKFKRFRLFTLLCFLTLVVGFVAMFIGTKAEPVTPSPATYDLANTLEVEKLKFGIIDDVKKEAAFIGLEEPTSGSISDAYEGKTINVPENVTIDGTPYKVTEVRTDIDSTSYKDSNNDPLTSLRAYGSGVTALVLPDSILKINDGALFGMANLRYYKAPFVGKTLGDEDNPLFTVFSTKVSTDTVESLVYAKFSGGYGAGNQVAGTYSKFIPWYKAGNDGSKMWFSVPSLIEKVVITGADLEEVIFGDRAFWKMDNLKSVVLPEKLTTVGIYEFNDCVSLKEIELSNNTKNLGNHMFSHCESLEKITIPYGVSLLPNYIFAGCTLLSDVELPNTVLTISDYAFQDCVNLKTSVYTINGSNEKVITSKVTAGKENIDPVRLPDSLTTIGKQAFEGVTSMSMLAIPLNVTEIGAGALMGCTNLVDLSIPFVGKKVRTQDDTEDTYPTNERSFGWIFGTTPKDDTYAAYQNGVAYYIPNKLETIAITNAKYIGKMALGNLCKYSNTSTILYGVNTISVNSTATMEDASLTGSLNLETINVPNVNSKLGTLFTTNGINATDKSKISLDNTEPQHVEYDTNNQELWRYGIPAKLATVTVSNQHTIVKGTFASCRNIVNVTIGNNTKQIDDQIFENNQKLASITLPFVGLQEGRFTKPYWYWRDIENRNRLAWIFSTRGGNANPNTYVNSALDSSGSYNRYIPNTLVSVTITNAKCIDYYSFRGFSSLESLTIKDNRSNGGNALSYISSGAAAGCYNLTSIELPWVGYDKTGCDNGVNSSSYRAAYIFGSDKYTNSYEALGYYVPNSLKTVRITYANNLPDNAFSGMASVDSIIFNSPVYRVGYGTFNGCANLTTLTYPSASSFTKLGAYAFNGCKKISRIETALPLYNPDPDINDDYQFELGSYALAGTSISEIIFKRFKTVGDYCFSGCLNLSEVKVTANVTSFGKGVFQNCRYLQNATLSPGQATAYLFSGCTQLVKLDLRSVISDGILPEFMLQDCKTLTKFISNKAGEIAPGEVLVTDQITIIEQGALSGCTQIETLDLPSNLKVIGKAAFIGLKKIPYAIIPVGVQEIGSEIFTKSIGNNFIIWVYQNEDAWPETWTEGWNNENPVITIPGDTESIYDFQYSKDLGGYLIVGFNSEATEYPVFEGTFNLPRTHNSVKVVGIINNYSPSTQSATSIFDGKTKITRFVVPDTYKVIGQYTLSTGSRTDLYFEGTVDNLPDYWPYSLTKYFNENPDNDYDANNDLYHIESTQPGTRLNLYDVVDDEKEIDGYYLNQIISEGFVFTGDTWEFGQGMGGSSTPFVKLSSLKVLHTGETNNKALSLEYNGSARTPQVDSISYDPRYVYIVGALADYNNNGYKLYDRVEPLNEGLFSVSYQDNVKVSTDKTKAKTIFKLNGTKYTSYLADNVKNSKDYSVYLTGTGLANFEITPYEILVYYKQNSLNQLECFVTQKTYNNDYWRNSTWGTDNLSLYRDFGTKFTFAGTLQSNDRNAGKYMRDDDITNLDNTYKNNTVHWSGNWNVYLNGANVTSNFIVNVGVKVIINPKEIEIQWVGRRTNNYIYRSLLKDDLTSLNQEYSENALYYVKELVTDKSGISEENLNSYFIWDDVKGAYVNPSIGQVETSAIYKFDIAQNINFENYKDLDSSNKPKYFYRETERVDYEYTGDEITPQAAAFVKNSSLDYRQENLVNAVISIKKTTTYSSSVVIYPDQTDNYAEVVAHLEGGGAGNYKVINYNLLGDTVNYTEPTDALKVGYKVVPAYVTITLVDNKYVIPYNADYYSFSDWNPQNYANNNDVTLTITGLSSKSTIIGELVSISNLRGHYTYSDTGSGLVWNKGESVLNKLFTSDQILQLQNMGMVSTTLYPSFVIGQIDQTGQAFVDDLTLGKPLIENDYYIVRLSAEITINYNKFDIDYYITNTDNVSIPLEQSAMVNEIVEKTAGLPVNTDTYVEETVAKQIYDEDPDGIYTYGYTQNVNITYHFDGTKNRYFKLNIVNDGLFLVPNSELNDADKLKISYTITDIEGTPISNFMFAESLIDPDNPNGPLKDLKYKFTVTITRKNFITQIQTIYITIAKCEIEYDVSVLNKDYDGKPVSLYGYSPDKTYYIYDPTDPNEYVEYTFEYAIDEYTMGVKKITKEEELINALNNNVILYYKENDMITPELVTNFITRYGQKSTLDGYTHIIEPETQNIKLTFYTYEKVNNVDIWKVWDEESNPTYPGTYYIRIEATNHDFFNGLNKYVEVTIEKRTIDVYVDSSDVFIDDKLNTGVDYNAQPYTFKIDSANSPSIKETIVGGIDVNEALRKKYFVGTDNIYGNLQTSSASPKTYETLDSTNPGDYVWPANFVVVDSDGNDHTDYYQVVLHNSFTIRKLTFNSLLSVSGWVGPYDGAYHGISVSLTSEPPLTSGYTISYATANYPEDNPNWRSLNYYYNSSSDQSGTMASGGRVYTVWYRIMAPNYETVIASADVRIFAAEITFEPSNAFKKIVDPDDGLTKYEVYDPDPDNKPTTNDGASTYVVIDDLKDFVSTEHSCLVIDYTWEDYFVGIKNVDPYNAGISYSLYKIGTAGPLNNDAMIYHTSLNPDKNTGMYHLTYTVRAYEYEDYTNGELYIYVTEKNLTEFTSYSSIVTNNGNNYNYTLDIVTGKYVYECDYNGYAYSPQVSITDPTELNNGTIYYRLSSTSTWTLWSIDALKFTNAGTYDFEIRVTGNGTYGSFERSYSIVINKITINSLSSTYNIPVLANYTNIEGTMYNGIFEYDGTEHTLKIYETSESDSTVATKFEADNLANVWLKLNDFAVDPLDQNSKNKPRVWYTTTTYMAVVGDNLDPTYWKLKSPTIKNVGTLMMFIRIEMNNYEYMDFTLTIKVTKCEDPLSKTVFTQNAKVQYREKAVDLEYIGVKNFHDGTPQIYWYTGILSGTDIIADEKMSIVPYNLGKYFVKAIFPQTQNCGEMTLEIGFEIIPRRIVINYEPKDEYEDDVLTPVPTAKSGTTDVLIIGIVAETDDEAIEIGEYHYKFVFATDQTNYVIVEPGSADDLTYFDGKAYSEDCYSGDPNYPFNFTITKRKLAINFYEEMSSNYTAMKYWERGAKKDVPMETAKTEWENEEWYNMLKKAYTETVDGKEVEKYKYVHHFSIYMISSSYANGYYYCNPDSGISYLNTVNVSDLRIKDDYGNDVSEYYDVSYDIVVRIKFPEVKVAGAADTEIIYDGKDHSIEVVLKETVTGAMIDYMSEEDYLAGSESWSSSNIKVKDVKRDEKGNVIPYKIYYRIQAPLNDDTIGYQTIKIIPCDLTIEIADYEVLYDGSSHATSHEVFSQSYSGPVKLDPPYGSYVVKYYKTSEYTQAELASFYGNDEVDESADIYINGLSAMIDASDYYAVVYYKKANNWYAGYSIKTVTVNRRPLIMSFANDIYLENDYDTYKYLVGIGSNSSNGANIAVEYTSVSGLMPFHQIVYRNKSSKIQTISKNAGDYYGSTGFEFVQGSIIIQATSGSSMGKDVTMNYQPVFTDTNLHVRIKKIALTAEKFKVEDYEYEYNGKPAKPKLTLPLDDDGELDGVGEPIYEYYLTGDEYSEAEKSVDIGGVAATNVGTYRVTVTIPEGVNYKAWTSAPLEAYVTITKKKVDVEWSNLETTFNGKAQVPNAKFTDVFGNKVILAVKGIDLGEEVDYFTRAAGYEVYISTTNIVESVAVKIKDSGSFEVEKNYLLENTVESFKINKAKYIINIEEETSLDGVWSKEFDQTNIGTVYSEEKFITGDIIEGLVITDPTLSSAKATIKTKSSEPSYYYANESFNYNYKAKIGDVDYTESIEFEFNGYVQINAKKVKVSQNPDNLIYRRDGYKVFGEVLYITWPINLSNITYTLKVDVGTENETTYTGSGDLSEAKIYSAGYHIIYYYVTCDIDDDPNNDNSYIPAEGSISVYIDSKEAEIEYKDKIDGEYNGTKYDSATVINNIRYAHYNGWTGIEGVYPGLTVKFYHISSPIIDDYAMDSVVDAGTYRFVVTADADTDDVQNYTNLYDEVIFTIGSKTIKETITIDHTRDNYTYTTYNVTNSKANKDAYVSGLKSGTKLYYVITASNIYDNSTYYYHGLFGYASDSPAAEYKLADRDSTQINGTILWYVYDQDSGKVEVDDERPTVIIDGVKYLDYSANYTLDINITLIIHYRQLEVKIKDEEVAYDGQRHHAQTVTNYKLAQGYVEGTKYYVKTIVPVGTDTDQWETKYILEPGLDEAGFNAGTYYIEDGDVITSPSPEDDPSFNMSKVKITFGKNTNCIYENVYDKNVSYKLPGEHTVYYKVVYESDPNDDILYEEIEGTYKIIIRYLVREIEFDQDWLNTLSYTGQPLCYTKDVANDQYLPKYTTTVTGSEPDVLPSGKYVTARYFRTDSDEPLKYPINAGKYRVEITIPASEYYGQITRTSEVFEVKPRTIYVVGEKTFNYNNGNPIYYNDFYLEDNFDFYLENYGYKLVDGKYVIDAELATDGKTYELKKYSEFTSTDYTDFSSLKISNLVIRTSGSTTGTYLGVNGSNNNGVYYTGQPKVMLNDKDATTNFNIQLYKYKYDNETVYKQTTIKMIAGTITYTLPTVTTFKYAVTENKVGSTVEYTPVKYSAPITGVNPYNAQVFYSTTYTTDYENTTLWKTEVPEFSEIKYNEDKTEILPYTYYAYIKATNYDLTPIITLTLKIVKGTVVATVSDESKQYDGESVHSPRILDFHNPESKINPENGDIKFYRWESTGDVSNPYGWVYMDDKYPTNAGKYKMTIHADPTLHFEAFGEEGYEFEISSAVSKLTWSQKTFVYNGEPQAPTATFTKAANDKTNYVIEYEIVPSSSNINPSDTTHTWVGYYEITFKIYEVGSTSAEVSNYSFDNKKITYSITKRKITVGLTAPVVYKEAATSYQFYYEPTEETKAKTNYGGPFTVDNLVGPNGAFTGHKITNQCYISTLTNVQANYTKFDGNFTWEPEGHIVILDPNGTDVYQNYNVTYNVDVFIKFNTLKVYSKQTTYQYDGQYHGLDIWCDNVFASDKPQEPTYTYAWCLEGGTPGAYTSDYPTFKEVGTYIVYYKANYTDYPETSGSNKVIITKTDAGLHLVDNNKVFDKYYDGTKVSLTQEDFAFNNAELDTNIIQIQFEWQTHNSDLYILDENSNYIAFKKFDSKANYYKQLSPVLYEKLEITSNSDLDIALTDLAGEVYLKLENGTYVKYNNYSSIPYYYYETKYGISYAAENDHYKPVSFSSSTEYENFEEGYQPITEAINAGTYRVTASTPTESLVNYIDAKFVKNFVIKKRTITITNSININKNYNGEQWSTLVYNSSDVTYDLMRKDGANIKYQTDRKNPNYSPLDYDSGFGLIKVGTNEETFSTTTRLQTILANAGTYFEASDYGWESGCKILGFDGVTNTTKNYNIVIAVNVEIVLGEMTWTATSYEGMVDGMSHSITIDVENPSAYTIYYSDDGITYTTDDSINSLSVVGLKTVYFKIEAPNFQTVTSSRTINLTGLVDNAKLYAVKEVIYGEAYDDPYVISGSTADQIVTYYSKADKVEANAIAKPTDVGTYYFNVTVPSDSLYAEKVLPGMFTIVKREVKVRWGYLEYDGEKYIWTDTDEFTYIKGQAQKPYAMISDPLITTDFAGDDNLKVGVTADGDPITFLLLNVEVENGEKETVGSYKASAAFTDNTKAILSGAGNPEYKNYKLLNESKVVFKIVKQEVEVPSIKTDLEFEYHFYKSRENKDGSIYHDGANQFIKTTTYNHDEDYYSITVIQYADVDSGKLDEYYVYDGEKYVVCTEALYPLFTEFYQFEKVSTNVTSSTKDVYVLSGNKYLNIALNDIPYDPTGSTKYYYRRKATDADLPDLVNMLYTYSGNGTYTLTAKDSTPIDEYSVFFLRDDVNNTNFGDYVIYSGVGYEEVHEYGDVVVITDTSGMKYVVDENGIIIQTVIGTTVNDNPGLLYKFVIESEVDEEKTNADSFDGYLYGKRNYTSYHKLTIVLLDPNNYCWKDQPDPDADVVFKYQISPYVPDETTKNTKIEVTALDTEPKYKGTPIEPEPIVRFYESGVLIFKLVKDVDYEVTYENNVEVSFDDTPAYKRAKSGDTCFNMVAMDPSSITTSNFMDYFIKDTSRDMYVKPKSYSVEITYYNPVEVTNPVNPEDYYTSCVNNDSNAKIIVRGINNFEFEIVYEFNIYEKTPEKFKLVSGAKAAFIQMEMVSGNVVMTDLSQDPTIERAAKDPKIYLGNLHQETNLDVFLEKTFQNYIDTPFLVSVYDTGVDPEKDGAQPIDPTLYSSTYVGTGFTIVLRNEKGVITDKIVCSLRGDIDGDGIVNGVDAKVFALMLSGDVYTDGFYDEDVLNSITYTSNSLVDIVQYYSAVLVASDGIPTGPQLKDLYSFVAGDSPDINGEYAI